MALRAPKRTPKDPEGRMPLREHLAELRRRLIIAVVAILLGAIAGWYLYLPLFQAAAAPLSEIAAENNIQATLTITNVMQAFNLRLKIAVYLGIVVSSPVWLYQSWAFVLPGLTRREKWHAIGFAAAGVPLFLSGTYVGWVVMPNAVKFFAEFAPENTALLPDAGYYLGFVTRMLLVFGLAFLIPLVLVALNLAGLMSARAMASGWRVAVFLIFIFAAIASPTPDAASLMALALPMTALYAVAVGIATVIDRRRARRSPNFGVTDDEASVIAGPAPLDSRYDDIT